MDDNSTARQHEPQHDAESKLYADVCMFRYAVNAAWTLKQPDRGAASGATATTGA